MEALLYFALWGAAIFLMMRFGCGAHVMGHGHRHGRKGQTDQPDPAVELRWVPPEKDFDPVCRETVATNQAKPSVYGGNVYYFCSRECREAFEAAPDVYVGAPGTARRQPERSHA
jgi:YHS domain-containing protein